MVQTIQPKIGQRVPNLPQEYTEGRYNIPEGLACLMVTEYCPVGIAVLIKGDIIVDILSLDESFTMPDSSLYDAIIMNPDCVPPAAVEAAIEDAKKLYS
jgi:hypothetical protein